MRWLQRASAILAWSLLAGTATLMLLEASGTIGEQWRRTIADGVARLAAPTIPKWTAALLGVLLALTAVIVIAAQLARARRVVAGVTIDRSADGSTEVTAQTIYRAITHQISALDEIYTVTAVAEPKRFKFRIELTDSGRIDETATAARSSLGPTFWQSIGMEPKIVDLLLTYRKGSTPVTRKEQLA